MKLSHRIVIADRNGESVRGYNPVRWNFAEDAARLPRTERLPDRPEIRIVTRALIRVAFEAERLKVGDVVLAPVLPWENMIDLNRPLIG